MKPAAVFTLFAVVVQISLGGAVRLTGSGLSCPDWPLCNGLWIPTPDALAAIPGLAYEPWQVMLEWPHRTNAALVVAPAALLLTALAWRTNFRTRALGILALALVVAQALLGRFTVLDLNSPASVAAHLVLAFSLVVVLVGMASAGRTERKRRGRFSFVGRGASREILLVGAKAAGQSLTAWSAVLLAVLAGTVGAYVAKTGASSACAGWPGCGGPGFPDFAEAGVLSHMPHRAVAAAVAVAVGILLYKTARNSDTLPFSWSLAASALVILQIVLGALVVLEGIPFSVALLHQGVGTLIVISLSAAAWTGQKD